MPKYKYVDCPKCGVNYSTATKHKCFKPDEQKDPPKFDNPEEGDDQQGKGDGQGKPEQGEGEQQQGQGKGGQGDGDGEGEGEGEGEGQGEGEGDGEGEGEGEDGEGEGEGPEPQPPEPEAPPVAVVCSVLKFGALTAQSAKNGVVTVTLAEDGLYVYGNNGDQYASETIPWGEFEKRSTVDGQFYVKEIIDGIDEKLGEEAEEDTDLPFDPEYWLARLNDAVEKTKAEGKLPEVERLELPIKAGQRVRMRDGRTGTATPSKHDKKTTVFIVPDDGGGGSHVWADKGQGHRNHETPRDIMANVGVPKKDEDERKLTLPLTVGQKVVTRGGHKGVVEGISRDGNMAMVKYDTDWWHHCLEDGRWVRSDYDAAHDYDLVADDAEPDQKKTAIDWSKATGEEAEKESKTFKFADGRVAAFYNARGTSDGTQYQVGIPTGMGLFTGGDTWAMSKQSKKALAFAKRCSELSTGWRLWVNEDGTAVDDHTFQVVVPK